jgi:hypothetical protein
VLVLSVLVAIAVFVLARRRAAADAGFAELKIEVLILIGFWTLPPCRVSKSHHDASGLSCVHENGQYVLRDSPKQWITEI